MWRDPLEELIRALEKVVDLPAADNSEASVEYLERSYATWQIEIDELLFGEAERRGQVSPNPPTE